MSDWFDEGSSANAADVGALLDTQGVVEAIAELVTLGALVSIGVTSDGGAMGMTITLDERRRREYFRDSDELRTWLSLALPGVRAAVERRPASTGSGSRRRRP